MITLGSLDYTEVATAAELLRAGSLSPLVEEPADVEAYWSAVLATRATGGDILVARDDHDLVGVLQLMVLTHFQHRGGICVELESFHVRENYRGRGIGSMMLAAAEERARALGAYRVQLTSNAVRVDAHRFYLREGYEQSHLGFKKALTN
jgi:GNAT superfamily N-acetyltransferase